MELSRHFPFNGKLALFLQLHGGVVRRGFSSIFWRQNWSKAPSKVHNWTMLGNKWALIFFTFLLNKYYFRYSNESDIFIANYWLLIYHQWSTSNLQLRYVLSSFKICLVRVAPSEKFSADTFVIATNSTKLMSSKVKQYLIFLVQQWLNICFFTFIRLVSLQCSLPYSK